MKKGLKIIGIVVVIIVAVVAIALLVLSKHPVVPDNYDKTVKTGSEIEAKYLTYGEYDSVDLKEITVFEDFKRYIIYYPSAMENSTEKFPVVVMSNGTGIKASKYRTIFKRLASWGFIVIGTDEEYSWNGFSSEMCLRLLIKLNDSNTYADVLKWENNPFYQSVDFDNIAAVGHSQGGVGAINSATEIKHASMIKTVVALSPANMEVSSALEWDYDPSLLTVPTLLISTTGSVDEGTIISDQQLTDIYNKIPDAVAKVKMRRNDADHGYNLYYSDGYVTAWLMWQLKGDTDAARAFVGEQAEILSNKFYQDVEKNY